MSIPVIQSILSHHTPNTTSRHIKSLGIQPEKTDRISQNEEAQRRCPLSLSKDVIGT